jgi:hypothetical protein
MIQHISSLSSVIAIDHSAIAMIEQVFSLPSVISVDRSEL